MKRIIFTIIVVIAVNTILAQTYNMKIKQGTGITYSVTTEVDEITFINTTTTPFVCGDVILHGGETYPTVLIGSQCWFQKNLNIGNRIDGSTSQADNSTIEKYCYGNIDANCTTYGGLYQWNEAMQYNVGAQGICPDGWHIPSYTEFTTLGGGFSYSSKPLKALGQGTAPGDGTNTSGFSSLLTGWFSVQLDYSAYFWASTSNSTNAEYMMLFHNNNIINGGNTGKGLGISVRCLKD